MVVVLMLAVRWEAQDLGGVTSKFSCVGEPPPTTLEQPKTVIGAIDVRSARERAHVNCNALLGRHLRRFELSFLLTGTQLPCLL
jgi:hypothetical protein